jgi:hypothetical protein
VPTASELSACKADALRLCNPGIADLFNYDRVKACMVAHRTKLSPKCAAVFKAHGF